MVYEDRIFPALPSMSRRDREVGVVLETDETATFLLVKADQYISIYDLKNGNTLFHLPKSTDISTLSPNGKHVLIGNHKRLWLINLYGDEIANITFPKWKTLVAASWSRNGQIIAVGFMHDVIFLNPDTLELISPLELNEQILEELKIKDVPNKIINSLGSLKSQCYKNEVMFLDMLEKQIGEEKSFRYRTLILKCLKQNLGQLLEIPRLFSLGLSFDGSLLATATHEGMGLYTTSNSDLLAILRQEACYSVVFDEDSNYCIGSFFSGKVIAYNLNTLVAEKEIGLSGPVLQLTWLDKNNLLVCHSTESRLQYALNGSIDIQLWDIKNDKLTKIGTDYQPRWQVAVANQANLIIGAKNSKLSPIKISQT